MKRLMEDLKFNKTVVPIKNNTKSELEENSNSFLDVSKKEKTREINDAGTRKQRKISITPRSYDHKPLRSSFKYLFFLVLLIGIIFWGGRIFKNAFITISSKHQIIEYNEKQFYAGKDFSEKNIDFEIMIESDKKAKDYILTESKNVSSKSSGSITLFNDFSVNQEKLVAGTYISDQDGKTYRLDSSVSIPGYKIEKGKRVPGQTNAKITSFLAGQGYNGSPEKFYINSFKGTTKYTKIYGKPKTELQGGLQGQVYYLTEDDKEKIRLLAETSFKNELFLKMKALLPEGYILYPGATVFTYTINDELVSETPEIKVDIEGTIKTVLLKENSLIDNIIKDSIPGVTKKEREEISFKALRDLTFSFSDENQKIDKNITNFYFKLSGQIEAIWTPNKDYLKSKMVGIPKETVVDIFKQEKGIVKAVVKIFPPWDKRLPNNPSKININIK